MIQVNYEKGHCYLILDRRYFHQLFLKHIKIYFYTQGRIYGGEAGRTLPSFKDSTPWRRRKFDSKQGSENQFGQFKKEVDKILLYHRSRKF